MLSLTPHPETPSLPTLALSAGAELRSPQMLVLRFALAGDLAEVRVPEIGNPRFEDGLWRHTCFEAFVRAPGEAAYCEFNFAPSRAWAAYRFRSYREGGESRMRVDPLIEVRFDDDLVELTAIVALDGVTPSPTLHAGLSAVVESRDGTLTYWALRHPPGRADFHHSDAFALAIHDGRANGRGKDSAPT